MAASERDSYELEETPARRHMLQLVLDKQIHTWAADPIDNTTNQPLTRELTQAFHDLSRAGLVIGENFTGAGYAAAVDWGLRSPAYRKR